MTNQTTHGDTLATLKAWHTAMQVCTQRLDQLYEIAGDVFESPLGKAIDLLMEGYTRTVATQIGWNFDTLQAWWTEHQFGQRPMQIGFVGQPLRDIATVEQLADFIVEDLARAAQSEGVSP